MEKFSPKLIVGGGNATDRHHALEMGEIRPDYVFFGKVDGDIKRKRIRRTWRWPSGGRR